MSGTVHRYRVQNYSYTIKVFAFTATHFTRAWRLWPAMLRPRIQHSPVHTDMALQLQVSLVLLRAMPHLHGRQRGAHLQVTVCRVVVRLCFPMCRGTEWFFVGGRERHIFPKHQLNPSMAVWYVIAVTWHKRSVMEGIGWYAMLLWGLHSYNVVATINALLFPAAQGHKQRRYSFFTLSWC